MKIKVLDQSFSNFDYKNPQDIEFLSDMAETEQMYNKLVDSNPNVKEEDIELMHLWVSITISKSTAV